MPQLDPTRRFLNKWQMHQTLAAADIAPAKLPRTALAGPDAIAYFLQTYPAIYIKPVGGWGGKKIVRADADVRNGQYLWRQQGASPETLRSLENVVERTMEAFTGELAIVQEAVPLIQLENSRPFDIRVLMQRDVRSHWVYAGTLARVGGAGAVVSNVAISRGSVCTPTHLFQQLGLGKRARSAIRTNLHTIGRKVAAALDGYVEFEEIGLDLGLDKEHQLWLIEANTNDNFGGPSHELFKQLPSRRLYDAIRARAEARQAALLRDIWQELTRES